MGGPADYALGYGIARVSQNVKAGQALPVRGETIYHVTVSAVAGGVPIQLACAHQKWRWEECYPGSGCWCTEVRNAEGEGAPCYLAVCQLYQDVYGKPLQYTFYEGGAPDPHNLFPPPLPDIGDTKEYYCTATIVGELENG